jgi:hypothetical protein
MSRSSGAVGAHHRLRPAAALSSAHGFLSGAWPFGVVEAIWAVMALNRFRRSRPY